MYPFDLEGMHVVSIQMLYVFTLSTKIMQALLAVSVSCCWSCNMVNGCMSIFARELIL